MSESNDSKGKKPMRPEDETHPKPVGGAEADADDVPSSGTTKKIPAKVVESMLEQNPALKKELAAMDKNKAAEALQNMDISQLLTGLSLGGKNQKDMASYKFWQTQPVPHFEDQGRQKQVTQGPIKRINPDEVSKTPDPLLEGFEWCTLDLTNNEELKELYELLNNHYVEDDNAMFRFSYSQSFLHWALMSPGWRKEWHVGVRATKSRKLVASICGVPTELRVRGERIKVTEINFLCIHKKLRSKRLTPVLIKEITRRCYINGIFQAIYTGGIILPTPVSSCRYYHRALDWLKLYEVGFSPLPHGSTKARQITKNHLPNQTAMPGLRPMESKDIDAVFDLLERYMRRFQLNQAFTREEIDHWLVHKDLPAQDQVVWSYVVEDPETHKITDFVSFYNLESTVIDNPKHQVVRAAYLYYYATETAFTEDTKALKKQLLVLINDALILAKKAKFDVFNALTLHDNPLFLEQLKFGAGDGQLHFYLYNYRAAPVPGGINDKNLPDEKRMGGVGITRAAVTSRLDLNNGRRPVSGARAWGFPRSVDACPAIPAHKTCLTTGGPYATFSPHIPPYITIQYLIPSAEELSYILAERFATKCFTPLELTHFKDNFFFRASEQGGLRYWNEKTLSDFLGIPDGSYSAAHQYPLDAGPVLFRMVSYLGAFPFQSTMAPSVLTFEAMVKVVVLLTERYGKVLKRGRRDRIKLLFGSLADVGRKDLGSSPDRGAAKEGDGSGEEEEVDESAAAHSHAPGFAIDEPGDEEYDEDDEDDDLALAALESLDAIEVFKHDHRIDKTVYETRISIDTFRRLLMLLLAIAPLNSLGSVRTFISDLHEERLDDIQKQADNIIAAFSPEQHDGGISYKAFARTITSSLPYLFDPLTPLFEHLLFSKNLDFSKKRQKEPSHPIQDTIEKKEATPRPSPLPSIMLPGSFESSILNPALTSHLSFFLSSTSPSLNLFRSGIRLHPVFSTTAHGSSLTSFSHHVLTWQSATLLILHGAPQNSSSSSSTTDLVTLGAYLPQPWKSSSHHSSTSSTTTSDPPPVLFQLSPTHLLLQGNTSPSVIQKPNLPPAYFSTHTGIALGCQIPPSSRSHHSQPTPHGAGSLSIDVNLETADFIALPVGHDGVFLPSGTASPFDEPVKTRLDIYALEVWGVLPDPEQSSTEEANAVEIQRRKWEFEAREVERRRSINIKAGAGDPNRESARWLLETAGIIGDQHGGWSPGGSV
ncbi:hypothetical protein N7474_008394 [Penicillium riverlandense]|uniref:uncharacterized protein n=1 Tax=Penicillium riverlandense TaxID=1903569 RepID=UPI00254773B5|nr:uncharacterized protein N7474_008394 [Penicillium riverlandense]KAJ5812093.1 hypothetical protein N7474_008394 [Penicillium riverlandense]